MSIFDKVDPDHIITKEDYNPHPIPYDIKNARHLAAYGKTMVGKSNLISNLLQKYYLFKYHPKDIYIFSPSFNTDPVYRPVRNYMKEILKFDYDKHVHLTIDIALITKICNSQREKLEHNENLKILHNLTDFNKTQSLLKSMGYIDKHDRKPKTVNKIFMLFDDVLGDKSLSLFGVLSTWVMKS